MLGSTNWKKKPKANAWMNFKIQDILQKLQKKILDLELELAEYQKKLAEQVLINDLLKKLRMQPNFQPEKNVTGLTDIIKSLNQKKSL